MYLAERLQRIVKKNENMLMFCVTIMPSMTKFGFSMKKLLCGILCWLSVSSLSYATGYTIDELPSQMFLTQHWISYTTSFDIETKTKKLGTLYRRVFSFPLTYDFYDNSNVLMTSARARFFSIGAHFDVYDANNSSIGSVEEKIFTFFPSFVLYSNHSDKVARAEMNFWGTTFTVYDMHTDRVMAVISRSFFRIKNDWTIDIKDKELLRARNVDPGLFITVLAFQADREYWEQQRDNNNSRNHALRANSTSTNGVSVEKKMQDQVKSQLNKSELGQVELMSTKELEQLSDKLQNDYQSQAQTTDETMSSEEKMTLFVDYCLSLVHSDEISPEEKKGILYLLEQRLGGVVQDNACNVSRKLT